MSSRNKPVSSLPNPLPVPIAEPHVTRPVSASSSDSAPETFHDATTHFSPAEEASLLSESNEIKFEANTLFSQKRYSEAISTYDRALASCPNYLDYEIAVLKSNVSACHLQLEEWKAAVDSATEALEGLERLAPLNTAKGAENENIVKEKSETKQSNLPTADAAAVVEISSDEDESAALHRLSLSDARRTDIARIRVKSLLRRARARHKQQTWSSLAGTQEDYTLLLSLLSLSSNTITTTTTKSQKIPSSAPISTSDLAAVKSALSILPSQIASAKEKEMGEMMGKLKELGNGILKPFGLSTDNFNMVKDEKTGGYSMNFGGEK